MNAKGEWLPSNTKMINNLVKLDSRNQHIIDILNTLRKSNQRKVLVLSGRREHLEYLKDSVDKLIQKDIDDGKSNQPGSEAVENSDYMKHIVSTMDKYPNSICLLLINQMTDKIGFGQKGQSRSGGHKISFHSSMIIELKKIKTLTKVTKGVELKTGIITQAK